MEVRHQREPRFTEAIQMNRVAMFRIARAMLHSDVDAEDAVSSATLNAWKNLPQLKSMDNIRPWLMRITVNACHDILRKRKREVPYDTLPEPQLMAEETPLWMYIEMLTPSHAAIMQMRFGEGMALEDICNALHLSKGTVSSRITRGKQELKRLMEREVQRI
ncbi:MAG: RNA polymerase sigma factor [Clostridia bacterium]